MSDVLEREKTKEDTDYREDISEKPSYDEPGDHDRFQHYFKKKDVDEAIFTGKPAKALCGKKDVPTRPTSGLTVCPSCKETYEKLRD